MRCLHLRFTRSFAVGSAASHCCCEADIHIVLCLCTLAVQAYSIGNEWIRAVAVLDMIGEAGLQPDAVSYNTAIQAVRVFFSCY
jgi:hypothetical protein